MAIIARMVAEIGATNEQFRRVLDDSVQRVQAVQKQIARRLAPGNLPSLDIQPKIDMSLMESQLASVEPAVKNLVDRIRKMSEARTTSFIVPEEAMKKDREYLARYQKDIGEFRRVQQELEAAKKRMGASFWAASPEERRSMAVYIQQNKELLSVLGKRAAMSGEMLERTRSHIEAQAKLAQVAREAATSQFSPKTIAYAKEYAQTLAQELTATRSRIARDLGQGVLTPQQAKQQAYLAGVAYNEGLQQAFNQLQGLKLGPAITQQLRRELIGNMKHVGNAGGVALAQGVEEGVTRSRTAFDRFARFGSRAFVSIAFAAESFFNGSASGVERILRAVSTLGLAMGNVWGMAVAGASVAINAIIGHFKRAEQEAKASITRVNQFLDGASTEQMAQRVNDMMFGRPFADDANDRLGIRGLEAQNRAIKANLQAARDLAAVKAPEFLRDFDRNESAGRTWLNNVYALDYGIRDVLKHTKELRANEEELVRRTAERARIYSALVGQSNRQGALELAGVQREAEEKRQQEAAKKLAAYYTDLADRLKLLQSVGAPALSTLNEVYAGINRLGDATRRSGESLEKYIKRMSDLNALQGAVDSFLGLDEIAKLDTGIDKFLQDQKAKIGKFMETAAAVTPASVAGMFGPLLQQFRDQIVNLNLTNAIREGLGKDPLDMSDILGPVRDQLLSQVNPIRLALNELARSGDKKVAGSARAMLLDLLGITEELNKAIEKTPSKFEKVAGALGKVADYMRTVADALNIVGKGDLANVVNSAANTAANIGAAIAAPSPTTIMNAVGSAIATVSSIFSLGNKAQQENNRVLRENNQRLREVEVKLSGFITSGASVANAQTALRNALNSPITRLLLEMGSSTGIGRPDLQTQIDALKPFLDAYNMTYNQFVKLTEDLGFEIFDKNGRIVVSALDQLATGLEKAARALFTFDQTVQDQRSLSDLLFKLSGQESTPLKEVQRMLDIFNTVAPELLPGSRGIDLSGTLGQGQLRGMLQDLVQRLIDGSIPLSAFGQFQNLDEIISIVDTLAGSLNSMNDAVNSVNESMQNVPSGFKIAYERFAAQDAEMTLDPFSLRSQRNGGQVIYIGENAIAINGNRSPDEIATELLGALQYRAGQELGNSTRWSELQ